MQHYMVVASHIRCDGVVPLVASRIAAWRRANCCLITSLSPL
jgi:hypothetical protein